MTPAADTSVPRLEREARILTRYLLDRDCPPEMVQRYVKGSLRLHQASGSAVIDDRVADFVFRHPRALPFIDAAAAVTGSGSLVRAKLQLMAAILEASPAFTADFFPRSTSRVGALLRLVAYASSTGLKAAIGLTLLVALKSRAS